jgi:hypothetical protein
MSPTISGGNVIEGAVSRGDFLAWQGVELYVDSVNGSATGDGRSWATAFNTISLAMAEAIVQAASVGIRGNVRIYVAPGAYNEDVVTPLNTECPFGQLIAVNPTPHKSFGAAYIYASTAGQPAIKVRARGWLVKGFEIASLANTEAILLDGATANSNPAGFQLENCLVSGWGVAGGVGIDVVKNGAPHTTIKDCMFEGFKDSAIKCSESGTDQPRYWEIFGCKFMDNANHLNMNPRGFKESYIHDNVFMAAGANNTCTEKIDNTGGNSTVFTKNYLAGTYSNAGGYTGAANDEWGGNFNGLTGGVTAADPA